jgi:hypothetical protein
MAIVRILNLKPIAQRVEFLNDVGEKDGCTIGAKSSATLDEDLLILSEAELAIKRIKIVRLEPAVSTTPIVDADATSTVEVEPPVVVATPASPRQHFKSSQQGGNKGAGQQQSAQNKILPAEEVPVVEAVAGAAEEEAVVKENSSKGEGEIEPTKVEQNT